MSQIKTVLYPKILKGGGRESSAFKKGRRIVNAEIISGGTGLLLALFIMGHLTLESSILLGKNTYDAVAGLMEKTLPIAQVLIFIITMAFGFHFVYASRKIPAKLLERRKMMELGLSIKHSRRKWNQPKSDIRLKKHMETSLWIWQVRTGMMVLAMGAFHLILIMWNLFTNMGYTGHAGLSAQISTSRVGSGLWILYLLLGITVVVHLSIGLYRLAVKWIADKLERKSAYMICAVIFWVFLTLNILAVLGFAGKVSL